MTLLWVLLVVSSALGYTDAQNGYNYNRNSADNVCGYCNANGLDANAPLRRNQARFGEFPWVIAVLDKRDELTRYIGGGSLIAHNVVLTAAHILNGTYEDDIMVRAGEWDVSTMSEKYRHEDRKVSKIVRHEQFNSFHGENDIALLFLTSDFSKTLPNIRPICLPPAQRSVVGSLCFFNGWGKRNANATEPQEYNNVLTKVDMKIMDANECQDRTGINPRDRFVCADILNSQPSCDGDGGSPLVCPIPKYRNRFEQAGIVTWGLGCSTQGLPALFIDVAKLRPWIENQMGLQGIRLLEEHY